MTNIEVLHSIQLLEAVQCPNMTLLGKTGQAYRGAVKLVRQSLDKYE